MFRAVVPFAVSALIVAFCAHPAVAQTPSSLVAAAAPRLDFTATEMALAEAAAADSDVASFYGANGLQPVFAGPKGQGLRQALISATALAPAHGIPLARYTPEVLAAAPATPAAEVEQARVLLRFMRDMTGGVLRPTSVDPAIKREVTRPRLDLMMQDFVAAPDPAAYLRDLQPDHPAYLALQRALTGGNALAVPANLPRAPEAVWRVGMQGAGVAPLRARLASIGFTSAGSDTTSYDTGLADAVARYQSAAGLPADGVAGPMTIRHLNGDIADDRRSRAILMSMERMRWLASEDLDARHVWVNIPEFTAQIIQNGQQQFQTRVVVGKATDDHETPEFSDQMEHVVVNPRWNVPRSITVREYLPRLQKNRNAVSHLDIVDGRGNVISRDRIDFSRYTASNFPYRMRQQPSDDNALGLVKFIFPNPWNIYLHDTPTKHLFGESRRAYSHGCVRVADPFDLSYALLSQQTDDPQAVFKRALDSGRETYLALKPAVPVHLVYFTAFPDQAGTIRFYNDVYDRDTAMWAAMTKAGLDLASANH